MKFIENSIAGIKQALDNPETKSQELLFKLLLSQFQKIQTALDDKKKFITYYTYCGPVEIFNAMDSLVPICTEPFIILSAAFFGIDMKDFLDAAAGYGIPEDVCSGHRSPIGMALKGALPTPDLVISTSHTSCSDMKSGVFLKDFYGIPCYLLDTPYRFDEKGISYYANQLKGMVSFLEDKTGEKMDPARLKESVTLADEAISICKEINRLRRKIPTPMKNRDLVGPFLATFTAAGSQEAVDYLKALRDEIKKRDAGEEKQIRLYYAFVMPFFHEAMELFDWLENEHGAKIVMDVFSYWPEEERLDPDNPFESLARKEFYRPLIKPLLGEVERWTEDAVKFTKDYQADGVIFYTQSGCKISCSSIRTVSDAIRKRTGKPTLVIDGDVVDSTIISVDTIKTKLEGFFEMLEERD